MDPVSAGSGVLTFITVALSSVQAIHKFVSSFSDGPQNLSRAADSLKYLQAILLQLSHSRALQNAPEQSFLEQIKRCKDDLAYFAEKLRGLEPSESERRVGKFWKRVKTAFGEKELRDLQDVVDHHSQALDSFLTILQSNVVLESQEELDRVTQGVQSLDQAISHHVEITQNQSAVLLRQSSTLDSISNNLNHIRCGFDTVANDISGGLRTEIATNFTDVKAATSSQTEMISGLLRQFQELTTSLNAKISQQSGIVGEIDNTSIDCDAITVVGSSHGEEQHWDEHLDESIERLCSLVDAKERTIRSDKAADIITDLQALLDATRIQVRKIKAKEEAPRYAIERGDDMSDSLPRDLERLRAMFTAAPRLSINQAERAHPYPPGTVLRQTHGSQEIELGSGRLIITTNKRRRKYSMSQSQHDPEGDSEDDPEDFTAKLLFLPKDFENHKMIVASVHIHELLSGSSVSIPRLAVNRILPHESRVFDVVRHGDLGEFRLMLRRGEASFRDHDPHGASLLMHALRYLKPEMCRYLIDNGADTSHVSVVTSPWTNVSNVISCVTPESAETDGGMQCLRLLLEAGADPTFDDSLFEQAFVANTLVAELCLTLGAPFLSVHTTDQSGRTPLLAACCSHFLRSPMMEVLIRRGASLHARDSHGRTCLHFCMVHVGYPYNHPGEYDAVRFLVQSGADVRAVDHEGLTASDMAYTICDLDSSMDLGSYRGDLWDSVLTACGYDLAEFHKGRPRTPSWAARYTRKDFEALWAGMEEKCPYYSDDSEARVVALED